MRWSYGDEKINSMVAPLTRIPMVEIEVVVELILRHSMTIFYDQALNLDHHNPTSMKIALILVFQPSIKMYYFMTLV